MIRIKKDSFLDKVLSKLPYLKIIPICDPRTRVKVMIGGKKVLDIFSTNTLQSTINRDYVYFTMIPSKSLHAATYDLKESKWFFRINKSANELKEENVVYV